MVAASASPTPLPKGRNSKRVTLSLSLSLSLPLSKWHNEHFVCPLHFRGGRNERTDGRTEGPVDDDAVQAGAKVHPSGRGRPGPRARGSSRDVEQALITVFQFSFAEPSRAGLRHVGLHETGEIALETGQWRVDIRVSE